MSRSTGVRADASRSKDGQWPDNMRAMLVHRSAFLKMGAHVQRLKVRRVGVLRGCQEPQGEHVREGGDEQIASDRGLVD